MDQFKAEITIFGSTLEEENPTCSVILTDEAYRMIESYSGDMSSISSRREDGNWDMLFNLEFINGIIEQKLPGESISATMLRINSTKRPSRRDRRRLASKYRRRLASNKYRRM